MTATVWVRRRLRRRAVGLGTKSSSLIAARTRARVAGSTLARSLSTRLTVPRPTPASRATSAIVTPTARLRVAVVSTARVRPAAPIGAAISRPGRPFARDRRSRYHDALAFGIRRQRPGLDARRAEPPRVAPRPLEVVEQLHSEVAAHVDAAVHRARQRPDVRAQVGDPLAVVDGAVRVGRSSRAQPFSVIDDRQPGIPLVELGQDGGQPGRRDPPAHRRSGPSPAPRTARSGPSAATRRRRSEIVSAL